MPKEENEIHEHNYFYESKMFYHYFIRFYW